MESRFSGSGVNGGANLQGCVRNGLRIAPDCMAGWYSQPTVFENGPMQVREKAVVLSEPYVFPAASVTALELTTRRA